MTYDERWDEEEDIYANGEEEETQDNAGSSWDTSERTDYLYGEGVIRDHETYIYINGAYIDVEPDSPFIEKILEVARNAGLGKFRVFLNGREVTSMDNAPTAINRGDQIKLEKYDIAG